MTVQELIDLLRECNPDAIVWCEGCDCVNRASGIEPSDPEGGLWPSPEITIKITT